MKEKTRTKPKRKRRITVQLDGDVVEFIKQVALLANADEDTVITVLLAASMKRLNGGKVKENRHTKSFKDITFKQRGSGIFATWLTLLRSSKGARGRIGFGVKQENVTGSSTQYAWMTRDQATKLRDELTAWLRGSKDA